MGFMAERKRNARNCITYIIVNEQQLCATEIVHKTRVMQKFPRYMDFIMCKAVSNYKQSENSNSHKASCCFIETGISLCIYVNPSSKITNLIQTKRHSTSHRACFSRSSGSPLTWKSCLWPFPSLQRVPFRSPLGFYCFCRIFSNMGWNGLCVDVLDQVMILQSWSCFCFQSPYHLLKTKWPNKRLEINEQYNMLITISSFQSEYKLGKHASGSSSTYRTQNVYRFTLISQSIDWNIVVVLGLAKYNYISISLRCSIESYNS